MRAPRVVSLVPSATETLRAWGIEPVAVTRFCPPPLVRTIGGTKDPHLDEIVELRPDLVVACVEENRREDADALVERGLRIHAVDVDAVDDVPGELARLADAIGLDVAVPELPAPLPDRGITAFVPIWRRPWMTVSAGTYAASMLRWLGVRTWLVEGNDRYPTVELADAIAARPDVVLAPSEPYPFAERHRAELEQVAPTVLVDGQDLVWWGTRTPLALERLAAQLREALPDRTG
jgi:ABC-type Fe3+-hydroxamate transport system substrate-binding protein